MTKKLAFVYVGEVEGVFDADDNTMLGTWCCNDTATIIAGFHNSSGDRLN